MLQVVPPSIDIDDLPFITALLDDDGVVVAVNRSWQQFSVANGGRPDSDVGTDYLGVSSSDPSADRLVDQLVDLLEGRTEQFTHDYPCHAPQEYRWFRLHALRTVRGVAMIHQPITRETWLAGTVEGLPTGLLELDRRGELLNAGRPWLQLVDTPLAEQLGEGWLDHVHPGDRAATTRALQAALRSEVADVEVRVGPSSDGPWSRQRLTWRVRELEDEPIGVLVSVTDVTQNVRIRTASSERVPTDPTTGLLQRATFLDHLRVALEAATDDDRIAVVVAHLVTLGQVNSEHGHRAGDALLVEVARRLSAVRGPGDVVARHGGDAFAVLLRGVADDQAAEDRLGDLVEAVLTSPVDVDGAALVPEAAFGVALATSTATPSQLLDRAERASSRDARSRRPPRG